MALGRLWAAMETRDLQDAGTDSRVVLTINDDGSDIVHHTFPNTSQDDQERGEGNVYEVELTTNNLIPSRLSNSSVRFGIRGDDRWSPKHLLIWGEDEPTGDIVPIAIRTNITHRLSTDESEGRLSIPLQRSLAAFLPNTPIRHFIAVATTANVSDAGTSDDTSLIIKYAGNLSKSVHFEAPGRGKATFNSPDVIVVTPGVPEVTNENIDEIVLSINGSDAWSPSSFFLFGRRGTRILPLVHLPEWNLGPLSADPSEGRTSISLPRAPVFLPDVTFPGGGGGGGGIGFQLGGSNGGAQITINLPGSLA